VSEFYVAILARNSEGEIFATVPDLPGANSAAVTEGEALDLVIEFADDYVRDLLEGGHPVPPPRRLSEIAVEEGEMGRALIPVDIPGKSVKVTLSIDEAVLARADRAAKALGESRSGFFASAVLKRIRDEQVKDSPEEVFRALGQIDLAELVKESMSKLPR
jgi:predicted RNase H-like HicB family nuclease